MLVDIVNEQSLSEDVALIVGNAAVDQSLVARVSERVDLQLLGRPAGSRNPWYMWKLYRMLKAIQPDIIHAHLDSFIRLLKYVRAPRVLTVHTTGIMLSPQVSRFDAVYCISNAVRGDLQKRYPEISARIIQNGINFSAMRKKTNYHHKPFRIVHVSRLDHRQKGQDVLLYAIKKINESLRNEKATVDFIGDGPSRDYLLKLAGELGLGDCCKFLGLRSRSDVYDNLRSYDLLVQPSRIEGFGLTVVEGMAAGLPVLVSDIEAPMEVIGHGQYGYYFRSEDADDCAKQILTIMERCTLPDFVNDRKIAQQYAKNTYDVATTAKAYVRDYLRVIGSSVV